MIALSATVLAGLAALPVAAEMVRRPVTRADLEHASGQMADLPAGQTYYELTGPDDGPLAICIHGLSTPSVIFAGTARSLAALGYRVLTYDLYGRGLSARPGGSQTPDFFLSQLRALLVHLGLSGASTVLGFSMGAILATAFAAEEGTEARALVLVAPAGITGVYDLPRDRVWTTPVLGDWLMRVAGGWALRRELRVGPDLPTIVPNLVDQAVAETRKRGFLPALLSSRRHTLSLLMDEDHRRVASLGTPVLAIWGRADPVINKSAIGRLSELNPNAHHVEIKGAGHSLLQTHPKMVAEALSAFLLA
jgi:pimeloyl-ACP methyl ester carboxylesterase